MSIWRHARLAALAAIACAAVARAAEPPSRQELEDWFNAPPEKSAAGVNEGALVFLSAPPAKPVHHHHNALVITDATLATGWAQLTQCHWNLDRVPAAQILFQRDRTRRLEITFAEAIGAAWIEGASVQLKDVGAGAWLCVSAESQALRDNRDGTYSLKNGPFMRKFLDGYYPMHVSMDVQLETTRLRFAGIAPARQDGFRVWEEPGEVRFDAWFEGRLNTELRFSSGPSN